MDNKDSLNKLDNKAKITKSQNVKAKKNRKKSYAFRNFILELKRVRWPKEKDSKNAILKTLFFVVVCIIIFFTISFLATLLWNNLGVGF